MTVKDFENEIARGGPPPGSLAPLLRALWLERQGDWDAAHRIAQDVSGTDAARVHAYLHRKEGDSANARYWYHQAGDIKQPDSLEAEWRLLAKHLLLTSKAGAE
jgi:hypothetical protein